ncbi:MAG: low temperature requirement protein A [Solirubrobacterales bacterium]
MESSSGPHRSRLSAARREGERVTPLELFFDLVFVLAITQCTALMSHHPSWSGLVQGLLVLGVLWWAWVGYAWLTSVIDPEQGAIRLLIFAAMAAMLIAALCVPEAFGSLSLAFALALGVFRTLHIALFVLASPDDPELRRSVTGLAVSTAIGVGILVAASGFDGVTQGALWALALLLDMGGPYLFGTEGWRLVPGHFAERHGLIIIIALGESVVAIGTGAAGHLDFTVGAAAVLGVGIAAALWWTYFDVVALVSAQRLTNAPKGRVQNALARDSYSYIHLLLVAGIVLTAYGLETVLHHPEEHLHEVEAFALLGGVGVYLLGLVSFRYRHVRTVNAHRLGLAILLAALAVVATDVSALAAETFVFVVLWAMIAWELHGYDERRDRLRDEFSVAHSD